MGGATALHLMYRHLVDIPIAGVFALSTFLHHGSQVFDVSTDFRETIIFNLVL